MSRTLRRTKALAWTLLLASAYWSACREAAVTRQDLEEAEASWHRQGVTSYDIEVAVSGRGIERRVRVAVRDGAIAEATVTEHSLVRALNEAQARPYTVEGLFRTLAEEVGNGERSFVRVWFDARFGFPEHMELGRRQEGGGASALVLKVERFARTAPSGASLPAERRC